MVNSKSPEGLQTRQLNIKEIIKRTQHLSYLPSIEKQGCEYRGRCKETVFRRTSMFPKNKRCLYDCTVLKLANRKLYSRMKTVHHQDKKRLLPNKWKSSHEVSWLSRKSMSIKIFCLFYVLKAKSKWFFLTLRLYGRNSIRKIQPSKSIFPLLFLNVFFVYRITRLSVFRERLSRFYPSSMVCYLWKTT